MIKLVLISGKAGSGKDTLARLAKKELDNRDYKTEIFHFADLVKWFGRLYFGYKGEKDKADRKILQTLGTDIMRSYDPDYWAETIAKFISAVAPYKEWEYIFIPDFRFENEYEIMKKYCGDPITVKIERYGYENKNMSEEEKNHSSENSLNNFPFDIYWANAKDLQWFKNTVPNFVNCLLDKQ